jgi:hypothetical protein
VAGRFHNELEAIEARLMVVHQEHERIGLRERDRRP